MTKLTTGSQFAVRTAPRPTRSSTQKSRTAKASLPPHSQLKITTITIDLDAVRAFYLAEAGVSLSLNEIKNEVDPDENGIGVIAERALGDGTLKVEHDINTKTLVAIGQVQDTKRSIFVKYEMLAEFD